MDFNEFFSAQPDWQILDEAIADDPAVALSRDTDLVRSAARGEFPATARIWENPRSLIVTRRETRFPDFQQACDDLAEKGWPVLVRESGGTAVPHDAGILHLSLIFPVWETRIFDMDTAYQALCEPLKMALAKLGLKAEYGEIDGAWCDGRYNLSIGGLKVTGTAQRIVGGKNRGAGINKAVLAQAMLMVETDAVAGTAIVNDFYRLAGSDQRFNPDVTCSVRDLLPDSELPAGELTLKLRELIAESMRELAAGAR